MSRMNPRLYPLIALLAVFAVLCGVIGWRLNALGYFQKGGHLPVLAAAPAFQLTERSGRTLTNQDLEGRLWVASFIFTRCGGPCPLMSLRTQELTREVPGITAVSFTSDPGYDSPEVLARYADRHKADKDRWLFVTGPMAEMSRIAKEFNFGGIDQPDLHSTRFALVDGRGQVRGYYLSDDPEHLARLRRDIRSLA